MTYLILNMSIRCGGLSCKTREVAMSRIEQILSSIESLSDQEFAKLRDWFAERDWERWNKQIEEDSEAGKLDFLIKEALTEKEKDTLKEL